MKVTLIQQRPKQIEDNFSDLAISVFSWVFKDESPVEVLGEEFILDGHWYHWDCEKQKHVNETQAERRMRKMAEKLREEQEKEKIEARNNKKPQLKIEYRAPDRKLDTPDRFLGNAVDKSKRAKEEQSKRTKKKGKPRPP